MSNSSLQTSLYIAEHLFFLIENGNVLVWNYKTHEQYLLEEKYFLELLHISQNNTCKDEKILNEFLEANLVSAAPMKSDSWGWDALSKIFHVGTQNVGAIASDITPESYSENYISQCETLENTIQVFSEKDGIVVDLPEPDIALFEKISFYSALKNRKTCRQFNSKPITLEELSLILYCSFGLIHGDWEELDQLGLKQTGLRKASPSGGGIHAEEAYIVVYRVIGMLPGLYHYRPQDHKLTLLRDGSFEKEVIEMNYSQFFSEGMAAGIYITSRLEKIWWKYKHSRSYRTMLLDIGHISQTFLNCATALGLQTWLTAAFHDAQVENFLSLGDNQETVVLFVGMGKGTNQAIPETMINEIKKKPNVVE